MISVHTKLIQNGNTFNAVEAEGTIFWIGGLAKEGELSITITDKVMVVDLDRPMLWMNGCPKIVAQLTPHIDGIPIILNALDKLTAPISEIHVDSDFKVINHVNYKPNSQMKELTYTQKTFIKDNFFFSEKYAGWHNIADSLLTTGSCVVAGDSCIWQGGIGNYITTSEASEFIDCIKYEFNLEQFLSSLWFQEHIEAELIELEGEKHLIDEKIEDLESLATKMKVSFA